MLLTKKFKVFDDTILEEHPDLIKALKPNDHYPEVERILNNSFAKLPAGSLNTKLIINDGKIVERVFKTPQGKVISLFSKSSKVIFDQVA